MNKIYRVVWNAALCVWQAASEIAKGKQKTKSRTAVTSNVLMAGSLVLISLQATGADLPVAGQLVTGQATISQTNDVMNIVQSSDKAAIDWQSFDVGQGKTVNFQQPSTSSSILNRVIGSDVSKIQGVINANGKVFLINPNGILFTPTAQVNVGALVASTLNMSNENFNAGNYTFEGSSANAIINQGNIQTADGGFAVFIAAKIENQGNITANNGRVLMGAGAKVRLDMGGPVALEVEQGAIDAAIANGGAIKADDGMIYLSAQTANELAASVINHEGVIEANSLTSVGGEIVLEADEITLATGSELNAIGATGGGDILVGGDWQGSGDLHQATKVTMEAGASIDASATDSGDGGKVVLWSDITNPDSATVAHGTIYAKGGKNGGDGGRIETSGAALNIDGIQVNAGAADGEGGAWLLDPYDYTIGTSAASAISTALTGGSSVTVSTASNTSSYGSSGASGGSGSIYLDSAITASGSGSLTLNASKFIYLDAGITTTGAQSYTGDVFVKSSASLSSNGGNITFNDNIYALTGEESLTVNAGTGNVTFSGKVGLAGDSITTGSATTTSISSVSNLDTSGVFVYAADTGGTGGTIGDISFLPFSTTDVASGTASNGITIWNSQELSPDNWGYFGSNDPSTGNTVLDTVLSSIRWTIWSESVTDSTTGNVELKMTGLVAGASYKLQLLFSEYSNTNRYFDIDLVNGTTTKIVDDFHTATNVGDLKAVSYGFTATGRDATIKLDGNLGVLYDQNPILAGFSLEVKPNALNNLTVTGTNITASDNIAAKGTIQLTNTDSLSSVAGAISGVASLTKSGSGTLTLSGTNTYSGNTTISAGTLKIGSAGKLGSGSYAGNIANSGTFEYASSASQTLSGVISGSGVLGKSTSSSSTLTLSGRNTYTGTTAVSAGRLKLSGGASTNSSGDVFSASSVVSVSSGATLEYAVSSGLRFSLQTVSIGGAGTIEKTGSGRLDIGWSGAATFAMDSGAFLDIQEGNLKFGSGRNEVFTGNKADLNIDSGAYLTNHNSTIYFDAISGAGKISSGYGDNNDVFYIGVDNGSATFSGDFDVVDGSGSSGNFRLIKQGSGTQTLSGTNTYTGATTISSGTVSIAADAGLGAAPSSATAGHLTLNGGTLATTGTFTLSSNRGIALGSSNGTISTASSTTLTYGGVMAGSGDLTKSGSGTLTLSGANTYSGATTVSAGILKLGAAGSGSSSPLGSTSGTTTVASGAALDLAGYTLATAEALTVSGTGVSSSGAVYNSSSTGVTWSGATTLGADTAIKSKSGGALTWSGTINGAHDLTVDTDGSSSDAAFTLSGITGASSALTGLSINSGTANTTLSADATIAGAITVLANDITLGSGVTLTAGANENIVLAAEDDFINNSGASALSVSGAGRWIVYLADTAGNTYGNLNSGNQAVWGYTYATKAPTSVASGNRYVFAGTANIDVTVSTTSESKVYGETVDLSDNYSLLSTGIAALSNVYLGTTGEGITLSEVFSSNPSFASTKSAASASVGSASITSSAGTARSGYNVTYIDSGILTVTARPITITADSDQSNEGVVGALVLIKSDSLISAPYRQQPVFNRTQGNNIGNLQSSQIRLVSVDSNEQSSSDSTTQDSAEHIQNYLSSSTNQAEVTVLVIDGGIRIPDRNNDIADQGEEKKGNFL